MPRMLPPPPLPYDEDFDPADYADFESAEDRGDLVDMELDMEPCDECGAALSVYGAIGPYVIIRCQSCGDQQAHEIDPGREWDEEEDEDEDEEDEEE